VQLHPANPAGTEFHHTGRREYARHQRCGGKHRDAHTRSEDYAGAIDGRCSAAGTGRYYNGRPFAIGAIGYSRSLVMKQNFAYLCKPNLNDKS